MNGRGLLSCLVFLLLAAMAGCGGNSDDSASPADPPSQGSESSGDATSARQSGKEETESHLQVARTAALQLLGPLREACDVIRHGPPEQVAYYAKEVAKTLRRDPSLVPDGTTPFRVASEFVAACYLPPADARDFLTHK